MEVLSDLVEVVLDFFDIVWSVLEFLVDSIMGLITLIGKLPEYTALMTSGVAGLPTYCQTALATSIAVCIVWIVVKRGPAE